MTRQFANNLVGKSSKAMAQVVGFTLASVVDVEDPENLGRIRVKFPWHNPGEYSVWVIPASGFHTDDSGGTFSVPEKHDRIIVFFLEGNINRPAYGGRIWTPGGKGTRGDVKPRKTLIKGPSQSFDPNNYNPKTPPDDAPKDYPEPATGAWTTNDKTRRVNEWTSIGGVRILVEEFKRRIRFWSKKMGAAFKLTIENFDSDSKVDTPKAKDYHRLELESPKGTKIIIEEDETEGKFWKVKVEHFKGSSLEVFHNKETDEHYVKLLEMHGSHLLLHDIPEQSLHYVQVQHKDGHKFELWEDTDAVSSYVETQTKLGTKLRMDAQDKFVLIQDMQGQIIKLDEQAKSFTVQVADGGSISMVAPNGTVEVDGLTVNVGPNATVNLAGGGPPVARMTDLILVGTSIGEIITGSGKVGSG